MLLLLFTNENICSIIGWLKYNWIEIKNIAFTSFMCSKIFVYIESKYYHSFMKFISIGYMFYV